MKKWQTVVLFGDSLLMDSVEASLSNIQELGLVRIHSSVPNVVGRIGGLAPTMSRVEEVGLVSMALDELSQAYTSSVQRVGKDGNTRR